jgi:hypothetical protein
LRAVLPELCWTVHVAFVGLPRQHAWNAMCRWAMRVTAPFKITVCRTAEGRSRAKAQGQPMGRPPAQQKEAT